MGGPSPTLRCIPRDSILIGGDFNKTLDVDDRLNGVGGRDSGSAQFRVVLAQ